MFHIIQGREGTRGTGNWHHGGQQSLKFNVVFRRQIIPGQNNSRKEVLIQLKW